MEFKVEKGRKSESDRVLLVKTDGWELLSYREIFTILKFVLENEQKLYPHGKGAKYLLEAIKMLLYHDVEDVLAWFQLKKPRKLHHFM